MASKGLVAALALACLLGEVCAAGKPWPRPRAHLSLSSSWAVPERPSGIISAEVKREILGPHNVLQFCEEKFFGNVVDHFTWATHAAEFNQRYFVCDRYWRDRIVGGKVTKGPMLFYTGNEADVTLYVNASGFQWELAEKEGALLVFAEHRFYGKSMLDAPYDSEVYLTSEQALADYANLIPHIKLTKGIPPDTPVVAFGGSYGGMLASWFRMKYPHVVDGALAGSAPIWAFVGEQPSVDPGTFAEIVTYDASPAAGAAEYCRANMRVAWQELLNFTSPGASHDAGNLASAFRLCPGVPLDNADDVWALMFWAQSAFDFLAMGNYPYPSSYLTNGHGTLPAWPMRVACSRMEVSHISEAAAAGGLAHVGALADAVGIFYNNSGSLACYDYRQGVNNDTKYDGEMWDWQYCTEMFMPMSRDGKRDMFWPQPWDADASKRQCRSQWGVDTRPSWAEAVYGGKRIQAASNIIFSNGEYDPWRGSGVVNPSQPLSSSVHVIVIEQGAHHLDLMWSSKDDIASVVEARKQETAIIQGWISQAYARVVPRGKS